MPETSPTADAATATQPRPRRRRRWLTALALVAALLLGTGVYVGYRAQRAVDEATGGHGGSVVNVLRPQALNGEDTGAVNLLLAGNSFDDTGHDGADLTDSIMVVHLDLHDQRMTMVSIPRDLEVQYQGQSMKINQVYVSGGDGMNGLTALGQVVEQVTGLHVDQHTLVGYSALAQMVNAVGGIDVTINSSDKRGIHDARESLTLSNGRHHIDGRTALALCRARNDTPASGPESQNYGLPRGDFDRQANQRMVLQSLTSAVSSSSTLANPVKLVELFDAVGKHMTTDLTVRQIARLRELSKEQKGTTSVSVLGPDSNPLVVDNPSSSLGDALMPAQGLGRYDAIKAYVQKSIG